jgi:hypothetical protein
VDEGRYPHYVPSNDGIKGDLLQDHHDVPSAGHPGVEGALRQYFYWPNMHEDVADYVRSCSVCQLNKPCGQAPTTTPLPKHPFEEVALDWIGPEPLTPWGHDFCLNLTDRLTKVALAVPCKQTMSKHELAETLHYKLLCAHGIPRVIVFDRDRRIDNDFFRHLNQVQGTTHRLTTSHRPQGNGQAKALDKELLTKLKAYCSDPARVADWDTTIQACVHAYNTSVHTAHGYTPFYLVHGYHSVYTLCWQASEQPFPTSMDAAAVNQFRQHHHECVADAHGRLCRDAEAQKSRRSAPIAKQSFYKGGDHFRVYTKHLPPDPLYTKVATRYLDPFPIVAHHYPGVYEEDLGDKYPEVHCRVNADRLRPYL